eukprot:1046698-Rhodomonas_salina.2
MRLARAWRAARAVVARSTSACRPPRALAPSARCPLPCAVVLCGLRSFFLTRETASPFSPRVSSFLSCSLSFPPSRSLSTPAPPLALARLTPARVLWHRSEASCAHVLKACSLA